MHRFIERDKHELAYYGNGRKICTRCGKIFTPGPDWVEYAYNLYKSGFPKAKIKENITFIR